MTKCAALECDNEPAEGEYFCPECEENITVTKFPDDTPMSKEDAEKILKNTSIMAAPATSDLIIFEENLTADGLDAILEESKTWPVVARKKPEYDLIYGEHQRFKRLSTSIKEKSKELKADEKTVFDSKKAKIDKDLNFVLSIINPLIARLGNSRQRWDDEGKAYKEIEAKNAAIEQEKEHARQQLIREKQKLIQDEIQAHIENEIFDTKKRQAEDEKKLQEQAAKLKRERYEFECEKTRLDYKTAYDEAYRYDSPDLPQNKELAKSGLAPNGEPLINKPWSESDATPIDDIDNIQKYVEDFIDINTTEKDTVLKSGLPVIQYGPGENGGCVSSDSTAPDMAEFYKRIQNLLAVSNTYIDFLQKEYDKGFENDLLRTTIFNMIGKNGAAVMLINNILTGK